MLNSPVELDLAHDMLIPLRDVPKLPCVPRSRQGHPLHVSTVFRWRQKGIKGIRLRTARFGGTQVTTLRWLAEFFEQLAMPQPSTVGTPRQRRREQVLAEKELDEAGI